MPDDLQCWDCYVAYELADMAACPRHATPKQRAAAERRLAKLDLSGHPVTAALLGGRLGNRRYRP